MKRSFFSIALFMTVALTLFGACAGRDAAGQGSVVQVYFVNSTLTGVEMHECNVYAQDAEGELEELLAILGTVPGKLEYKAPLKMGFEVNSCVIDGEKVCVDVNEAYRGMSATTEVLVRASIVRTLSQIPGVKYVLITVDGGQLHDSLGNVVGLMSADQFIDNAGNEINAYDRVTLKLYFTDRDGTGLVVTNRTMAYNTNIPMEKLVAEQLIQGPGADVADIVYPTLNPGTKVVSISVKDGICYVNFDEMFLNQIYNSSAQATIYSIVNSLTELNNVNKVQISVNGETNLMYQESISLTTVFERNLDLITTLE